MPKQLSSPTNIVISSQLPFEKRLEILTGAAKYDASCASSGSSRKGKGLGAAHHSGICHSWSADGRCISLLKVLFSNACHYDCAYCLNRRSNDHQRASFTPSELARLTIEFYRRNYIEGLFLSSAIFSTPDRTMEAMLEVLRLLRYEHNFHGYIHLKAIPGCNEELVYEGTKLADRMSANVELPSQKSLTLLAPEKQEQEILQVFHHSQNISGQQQTVKKKRSNRGIGMSTQMIIGASPEDDRTIIQQAGNLYRIPQLKRVYYSAYLPVNSDTRLPSTSVSPPLLREHRLYQADWLLRFYDFHVSEILATDQPFLDSELAPKTAWALRNRNLFPVNINQVNQRTLLRVPGLGIRSCQRILKARRYRRLRIDDLAKLGVVMKRAQYFITDGFTGPQADDTSEQLRNKLIKPPSPQLSFNFSAPQLPTAISGEL